MPIDKAFEKRCEAMAASIRRDLGRLPSDRLPLDELLVDLGVRTYDPSQVPGMSESSLDVLFGDGAESWSAVTVLRNGQAGVIFNPLQSPARREMALVHELAHMLLVHTPSTLMFAPDGTWSLQAYGLRDEAEAEWLMGCLLLPTPVLAQVILGPWPESLAPLHGVEPELLYYRFRVTGGRSWLRPGREEAIRRLILDPPIRALGSETERKAPRGGPEPGGLPSRQGLGA